MMVIVTSIWFLISMTMIIRIVLLHCYSAYYLHFFYCVYYHYFMIITIVVIANIMTGPSGCYHFSPEEPSGTSLALENLLRRQRQKCSY